LLQENQYMPILVHIGLIFSALSLFGTISVAQPIKGTPPDKQYGVLYALAVPKCCPALKVNADLAREYTGALDSSANRDGLRNTIEGEVEMDMKEIGSGFCDAALNAFGSSGQAIQNLLYKNG
jgi:hypothetical protein